MPDQQRAALAVPERRVADTDSFPVSPTGVALWLAGLDPLERDADAHELVRGLTHSNRLHNDVDRRRSVIACFIPPLRALHERLADTARAQPLPLSAAFARAATLCDALLREEAIGFRLLLADAPEPRQDDARRAMLALVRRAELLLNGYRAIPDTVLRDAHQLFRFACDRALAAAPGAPGASTGAEEGSIDALYRHLLGLTLIDPRRHRARQLPLLLDWLRERSGTIALSIDPAGASRRAVGRFAVDTRFGTLPSTAGSMLPGEPGDALLIDMTALSALIGEQLDDRRQARASLLGADTLERQTLARLAVTLGPWRPRRHARLRDDVTTDVVFGHQDICAQLRYGGADSGRDEPSAAGGSDAHRWRIVDSSPTGLGAVNADAHPGSVQVGELALVPTDRPDGARSAPSVDRADVGAATHRDITLAIVRRVSADGGGELRIGLELLARAAMSVSIVREADPDSAPEQGLVVACRIGERSVQSLLVPPFLFQTGDGLRLVQGARSRRVELTSCLQLNGLFSHYMLGDLR